MLLSVQVRVCQSVSTSELIVPPPRQGLGTSNPADLMHILPILKPVTILEGSASDSHIPPLSA